MPQKEFIVRTIFLPGYFKAAGDMAAHRRGDLQNPQDLVTAMRRTQVADDSLQRELASFGEKGYELVDMLRHPLEAKNRYDLLVTAIFARDAAESNTDADDDFDDL